MAIWRLFTWLWLWQIKYHSMHATTIFFSLFYISWIFIWFFTHSALLSYVTFYLKQIFTIKIIRNLLGKLHALRLMSNCFQSSFFLLPNGSDHTLISAKCRNSFMIENVDYSRTIWKRKAIFGGLLTSRLNFFLVDIGPCHFLQIFYNGKHSFEMISNTIIIYCCFEFSWNLDCIFFDWKTPKRIFTYYIFCYLLLVRWQLVSTLSKRLPLRDMEYYKMKRIFSLVAAFLYELQKSVENLSNFNLSNTFPKINRAFLNTFLSIDFSKVFLHIGHLLQLNVMIAHRLKHSPMTFHLILNEFKRCR